MSNNAVNEPSTTAFGDIVAAQLSPVTQINAKYGLLTNVLTVTDDAISGTNSVVDNKFTCESGVSVLGLASILTLRQVASRAGQGVLARFSAAFNAPVADCTQASGLITAETAFTFAYAGTNFGILTVRDGIDELQELTLTVAAGAENATVTINAIPYVVALSGGGTVEIDAYEIQLELNSVVPNYSFTSNGAQVVAQAVIPATQGVFAYSSAGSSLGSWFQLSAGDAGTTDFIPQSAWNQDTRLTGDANSILDQQDMNYYKIQLDGSVDFSVKDKDSKKYVLVHRIPYINTNNLSNPAESTFRVGWLVRNTGNNSNVTIQGSYAASFIEGKIFYDTAPQGKSNNQTITAGAPSSTVIILRNRISFGNKVNRAEALPLVAGASSQTSKFAFFRLLLNPTFLSPVNFEYLSKSSSLVEFSLDSVQVTGGLEIGSVTVEAGAPAQLEFNTTLNRTTSVFPGSTIAVVVEIPSGGGGADCQANLTFQEDL